MSFCREYKNRLVRSGKIEDAQIDIVEGQLRRFGRLAGRFRGTWLGIRRGARMSTKLSCSEIEHLDAVARFLLRLQIVGIGARIGSASIGDGRDHDDGRR